MSGPSALEAAQAIRDHHAELFRGLERRVAALRAAVQQGTPHEVLLDDALGFLDAEIIPHARAEELTLYPAAEAGSAMLLVEAMRAEHRSLVARIDALRSVADPIVAVSEASAVLALFESHLAKENELLLPALLARPEVSLDQLLAGMHELVG